MRSDSQKIAKSTIVNATPAFGGCPLGDEIRQRWGYTLPPHDASCMKLCRDLHTSLQTGVGTTRMLTQG
jgi:hypothetical protein